jgi:hypothetical protein
MGGVATPVDLVAVAHIIIVAVLQEDLELLGKVMPEQQDWARHYILQVVGVVPEVLHLLEELGAHLQEVLVFNFLQHSEIQHQQ